MALLPSHRLGTLHRDAPADHVQDARGTGAAIKGLGGRHEAQGLLLVPRPPRCPIFDFSETALVSLRVAVLHNVECAFSCVEGAERAATGGTWCGARRGGAKRPRLVEEASSYISA